MTACLYPYSNIPDVQRKYLLSLRKCLEQYAPLAKGRRFPEKYTSPNEFRLQATCKENNKIWALSIGAYFKEPCPPFINLINQIPILFPNLENFSLTYPFMEMPPPVLKNLRKLRILNLSGAQIQSISDDFFLYMTRLRNLAIYESHLEDLPPSFFLLPSLLNFNLENDPPLPWNYFDLLAKSITHFSLEGDSDLRQALRDQNLSRCWGQRVKTIQDEISSKIRGLIRKVVDSPTSLTQKDMDYIVTYCDLDLQQLCLTNLSADHPLIVKFQQNRKISISNNFSLLQ